MNRYRIPDTGYRLKADGSPPSLTMNIFFGMLYNNKKGIYETMEQRKISPLDFKAKLIKLCGKNKLMQFPKGYEARLVLLGSIILRLKPKREYSEKEINEFIVEWLDKTAHKKSSLDYVTLRRYLVDFGLLIRDSAGYKYKFSKSNFARFFDSSVMSVSPFDIVESTGSDIKM